MITSLCISGTQLFSLTSTPMISIYSLSQFIPHSNKQLLKVESSLGICLRKPNLVFDVPFISGDDVKFVEGQQSQHEISFIVVYDRKSVVGLNAEAVVDNNGAGVKVLFRLDANQLSANKEKGQEISSVLMFDNELTQQPKILITTTTGKLHLFKLTQSSTLQLLTSTSLRQISSPTNQILLQEQEHSLSLIPSNYQQSDQYVSKASFLNDQLYFITNNHKVLVVKKEIIERPTGFEVVKSVTKGVNALGEPLKIVFARNSLLVLYNRVILEYNLHTHTLTNTISLPVLTLDLTVLQSPKTFASSLFFVGECNSLYSTAFPIHQNKNLPDSQTTRSVNISSRLGKCIRAKGKIIFVGGSDGTIDMLVNGEMGLAVLVQEK